MWLQTASRKWEQIKYIIVSKSFELETWVSSLTSLDLNHYRILPEGVVFTLTVPTKGTRPDETVQAFFTRYPADPALCPVDCFTHYLTLTREKRVAQQGKPNNLFISYIRLHHPVTKATIARWILSLIKEAGIDTEIFKAHSVRGASTTAAANALVPLQEILNMADWSNASTFRQFYYKPVFSSSFGETVLYIVFRMFVYYYSDTSLKYSYFN